MAIDRAVTVVPFYVDMMAANALRHQDVLPRVVAVGQALSSQDVCALLQSGFRDASMGAWYSLLQPADAVAAALTSALRNSSSHYSAPPLMVAAALLLGAKAIAPANRLLAAGITSEGAAYIAAGVAWLGGQPVGRQPTDEERNAFAALLAIGEQVRAKYRNVEAT